MALPFISSIRTLLLTFLKLLSGIEGGPTSDWGVKGNICLCDCSKGSDWSFSEAGRACITSSSCCASLFCPGTNECDRDTPSLTTGALMAAANSSSALKGDKNADQFECELSYPAKKRRFFSRISMLKKTWNEEVASIYLTSQTVKIMTAILVLISHLSFGISRRLHPLTSTILSAIYRNKNE